MLVATPGTIGSGSGGSFPPYGTWLSSVCSGPDAHDQGNGDYYDANGNLFQGMFTLWEQFADGAGGSYWTNYGNNQQDGNHPPYVACWLPAYFYFENNSSVFSFDWSGCGSSGNFQYGSSYSYSYSNGDGNATTGSGGGNWYTSGQLIYDGGCCVVYFDGMSGYYVSDNCGGGGGGCPEINTWLGDGCGSTNGIDASGTYFDGGWAYGSFFADGNCGQYFVQMGTNGNGCYYPAGWKFDYTSGDNHLDWVVNDSTSTTVAYGSFTYSSYWHSDNIANGNGESYSDGGSWSANNGDLIASGTYTDSGDMTDYTYNVYYDGMGGYYVYQNPV